jgi:hypothetical protein
MDDDKVELTRTLRRVVSTYILVSCIHPLYSSLSLTMALPSYQDAAFLLVCVIQRVCRQELTDRETQSHRHVQPDLSTNACPNSTSVVWTSSTEVLEVRSAVLKKLMAGYNSEWCDFAETSLMTGLYQYLRLYSPRRHRGTMDVLRKFR